jgi:hypothetical protein
VIDEGREPSMTPVQLEVDGQRVRVDGIEVRLLDEPDVGDLYNFCYEREGQEPSPPGSIEIRGHEVIAAWDRLLVILRVTRRPDEPFLRIEGVIHNDRPDHRLRLEVGLAAPVERSVAGSPFELVERSLVGEGSAAEAASATWPARHVVVAGDVALLHEGVFEYEVVDGRALAITLLRCVGRISGSFATRPWDAGPRTPTPNAQMLGETAFSVGIWPGAPMGAELLTGWERFGLPIVEAAAAGGGSLPRRGTFLPLDLAGAQLSNVRRVDDRLEVRCWNPGREQISARIDDLGVELGAGAIRSISR